MVRPLRDTRELYARSWDFHTYYCVAGLIKNNQNPYDANLLQRQAIRSGIRGIVFPYAYPPSALPFLEPLASLPIEPAFRLWTGLHVIFFTICTILLLGIPQIRRLSVNKRLLCILLVIAYDPIWGSLLTGQINAWITMCLLLAVGFSLSERHFLSGCALAMTLVIKPIFLPAIILYASKERRRGWLGIGVGGMISLMILGATGNAGWIGEFYEFLVQSRSQTQGLALGFFRIDAPANGSLYGQVSFLLQAFGISRTTGLLLGKLGMALVGLATVFIIFRFLRSAVTEQVPKERLLLLEWSLLVTSSCLLMPILWAHHLVFLLLPLAVVGSAVKGKILPVFFIVYGLLALPLTDAGLRLMGLGKQGGIAVLAMVAVCPPFWGLLFLWILLLAESIRRASGEEHRRSRVRSSCL